MKIVIRKELNSFVMIEEREKTFRGIRIPLSNGLQDAIEGFERIVARCDEDLETETISIGFNWRSEYVGAGKLLFFVQPNGADSMLTLRTKKDAEPLLEALRKFQKTMRKQVIKLPPWPPYD